MRAVMALSGGMDSTCLLVRLLSEGYRVDCLSFDYGQKHDIELERAKANILYLKMKGIIVKHRIVDLRSAMALFYSALTTEGYDVPEGHYEEQQMKQTVVPNRNAIFASILHGYALSIALREDCDVKMALGVHSGDHAIYPDCRPDFYQAIGHAFEVGNWESERVSMYLPYLDGDKESILREALSTTVSIGLDFDTVLANTNTSYNPDEMGRSSGRSGADVERILAFHAIQRRDPVEYSDSWDKVLKHALEKELEMRS